MRWQLRPQNEVDRVVQVLHRRGSGGSPSLKDTEVFTERRLRVLTGQHRLAHAGRAVQHRDGME